MKKTIEVRPDNYDAIRNFAGDELRCQDAHGVWIITPGSDVLAAFGDTLVRVDHMSLEILSKGTA